MVDFQCCEQGDFLLPFRLTKNHSLRKYRNTNIPPLKGAQLLRFEAQNWTHRMLHPHSYPLTLYNPTQGIPIHPPETKQDEQ